MKIETINQLSEIPKNLNKIQVALLIENYNPESLLFFCHLLDTNFNYYRFKEKMVEELVKSDIKFNVIVIDRYLSIKSIKSLIDYSRKIGSKIVFLSSDDSILNQQNDMIKKYDLIVVNDFKLKNSLISLNDKILLIPQDLNEEQKLIRESSLFDEENYISKYYFGNDESFDPIMHYLDLGVYENCNPFTNFELNEFLEVYPEVKKYNINPFTYYVILNQLFKFNKNYSIENLFENPSLSRLVIWDKNNTIIHELDRYFENEYVNNFYFELYEEDNKLIFKQLNRISDFKFDNLIEFFTKNNLMIKNRGTGKRILKEIVDFEAELNGNELFELGVLGIYDIHVQVSTLNRDYLFRVKFNGQNSNKILKDKLNSMILDPYETLDHYLAFKYMGANFTVKNLDVVKDNETLYLNGEIELFEDLDFETVELLMSLNQVDFDRKYIVCDYEKIEDTIKFNGEIDFKYYGTDLSKNFKIDARLKDETGIILGSRVLKDYKIDNLKANLKKYVKKAVFFESFHSKFYSGQPKYIYEKMLDLGLGDTFEYVWAYNGELEIPGSPMIVPRGSRNYNEILGASDYWITNLSFPFLKPNEETVYLQTTHGTPYKHMGSDIESDDENITRGRVIIESGTWNYLLSPNDFSKDVFKRSFEYDGPVINVGYPANDIFYQDTSIKQKEIKEKLNLNPNKKIILYCPTFRDYDVDEENRKKISLFVDLENLYENLGEEYLFLMRLHYSISKNLVLSDEMKDIIIDLSDYDDVADLYLISDILITDYSSVFFDFAHSKKPILFFVPDFEAYSSFRGLYSEVKEILPGPEIYTNEELVDCIKNISSIEKEYEEIYNQFYDKFCGLGHGTASEEVIDIVFGEDIRE